MNLQMIRTKSEMLTGLMGGAGLLLLVSSVPVGITFGLDFYLKAHLELRLAVIAAVVMAGAVAVAGWVLYRLCLFFSRRRGRVRGLETPVD